MDDIDSLLDSLIDRRKAAEVPPLDDKYAGTLEVKEILSKGQGVCTKQSISVNDPICSLSYPTMMAIDSENLPTTCYHCLVVTSSQLPLPGYGHASIELKTCNGCHSARFCGRTCQVKSWHAYHKYECKIFKKMQHNLPPAVLRAVLRTVLLKDRDMLSDEEWNRINAMASHEETLTARGRSNLTDMAEGIKMFAGSSMSVDKIQRLIFIMRANACELPTPVYGGIGVMLDPLVAKINHDCEPNLAIHRPQHTMTTGWMESEQLSEDERKTFVQLIPLRDIQAGEELLNCYVVPTVSVKARKAKLMEEYLFDCNCHKCQSDTKAIADLASEHPNLPTRFEQWTKDVQRHISRIKPKSSELQKATAAMNKSEQFLDYPVLYTSGDFPEMAMALVLEGLKAQAYGEALVNALRIYFLVNPQRFNSRHNPTNTYTIFLLLDIFDALLGTSTPPGTTNDKVVERIRHASTLGFSKSGLTCWRDRICADLRRRLEGTAAKDLLVLVEKREKQVEQLNSKKEDVSGEELRKAAEEEMRVALKLSDHKWKTVLQESGC
ncbi:hypothetical protein PMZ80_006431 [Knufia obscura]|uniref:Suppressor of anucleate metulae protein B n=2 Tax=Knufia TaxID=430999 RepID=A0AAN8I8V3_9EURO|nr:hypothetical protein PMZ80_006431 [Knufia obscura]KAK5953420.1 hypothetical protein OHC33_005364 [Knufia fluminis]